MDIADIVAILGKVVFAVAFVMSIVPILIWGERKWSAYIQDRPGPNRANIMGIRAGGLVHVFADVIKLFFKEDVVPEGAEERFWWVAPTIPMIIGLITFSVIPWGDHLTIAAGTFGSWPAQDWTTAWQISDINGGMLFILAFSSLSVYGIMLAGWGSNNKFSLMGGLRASAQMVSYELAMGLAVVAMFLLYGTPRLSDITVIQSGSILNWGVFSVPGVIALILFWTGNFAETNRLPFDLPEGESEIVAGYHLEYSSMRFALFFMAEYAHMIVGSTILATLFFGGYNVPFMDGVALRANTDLILIVVGALGVVAGLGWAVVAYRRHNRLFYRSIPKDDPRQKEPYVFTGIWLFTAAASAGLVALGFSGVVGATALGPEIVTFSAQLGALLIKVMFFCYFFVWVRWTLPRFRYDQLMNVGWRMMMPIAIVNVVLAAVWVVMRQAWLA